MILRLNLHKKSEKTGASHPEYQPKYDFIPYGCHFNPETLLTKNGELIQVIRVAHNAQGLPQEITGDTGTYIRDAIRASVAKHIKSSDYAFWFHSIRTVDELTVKSHFSNDFSRQLDELWKKQHAWKSIFSNEVYISILYQGQTVKLWDKESFQKASTKEKNRQYREAYLEESSKQLRQTTHSILRDLQKYFDAQILKVYESETSAGIAYKSELAEFYGRIVNLKQLPMPLADVDLSQQLDASEKIFGFNELEAKYSDGKKRYAAMLIIKHYYELPPEALDSFLQLPVEMVISQSFDFISSDEALEELKEIRQTFAISKDGYLQNINGLQDMLNADKGSPVDYGRQQTMIMVQTNHYEELSGAINKVQKAISSLGLIAIREDIKLEEAFWAQLPGNFEFLRRQHTVPQHRLAGLTRLNYFPTGEQVSRWGAPVCIFPTSVYTPYLFHYHIGDNGHTVILDYNSFPDHMGDRLLHFLLAQSTRFEGKTLVFDQGTGARALASHLNGEFIRVGGTNNNISFNPLSMEDNRRNRGFLMAWLAMLLKVPVENEHLRLDIKASIDNLFDSGKERNLSALMQLLEDEKSPLSIQLSALVNDPQFATLFSFEFDGFSIGNNFTVFDLQPIMGDAALKTAIFSYMLHRIILELDGGPTILVLKEAWDLLDNPFFASRLESLLEILKEKNAILIATTSNIEHIGSSSITRDLMRLSATHFFIPDDVQVDYLPEITGLSEKEDKILSGMQRQKGDFLLKHGVEVIPSSLQIKDGKLDDVLTGKQGGLVATRRKRQEGR